MLITTLLKLQKDQTCVIDPLVLEFRGLLTHSSYLAWPLIHLRYIWSQIHWFGIPLTWISFDWWFTGFEFQAQQLNKDIFETIYYHALRASSDTAEKEGPYETYNGSPVSKVGDFGNSLKCMQVFWVIQCDCNVLNAHFLPFCFAHCWVVC